MRFVSEERDDSPYVFNSRYEITIIFMKEGKTTEGVGGVTNQTDQREHWVKSMILVRRDGSRDARPSHSLCQRRYFCRKVQKSLAFHSSYQMLDVDSFSSFRIAHHWSPIW